MSVWGGEGGGGGKVCFRKAPWSLAGLPRFSFTWQPPNFLHLPPPKKKKKSINLVSRSKVFENSFLKKQTKSLSLFIFELSDGQSELIFECIHPNSP